jgi:hypothetical protein
LTLDGKPQSSWSSVLKAVGATPEDKNLEFGRFPSGTFYPPGFEGPLIKTNGGNAPTAFRKAFDRMRFEVCYCSLYNECWRFILPTYTAIHAHDKCPAPTRELDQ